jgi:hypothetical protein
MLDFLTENRDAGSVCVEDYDSVQGEETFFNCPHRPYYRLRELEGKAGVEFCLRSERVPSLRQVARFFDWVQDRVDEISTNAGTVAPRLTFDLARLHKLPDDGREDLYCTWRFSSEQGEEAGGAAEPPEDEAPQGQSKRG